MAILKDLIVHGSSRFLNKIYASELETPLIEAEAGIFKKLKADDATVVGLLDVKGQLHTNSWTNSNIATIDGSFYITPTIGSDSGTVTITATSLNFSGTNYAVTSLYLGDNSSITWPQYSKVLVTGQILSNGEWIPLGTLLGQLSATAAAASIKINNIKDNKNQTSSVLATLVNNGTTSSNYRNLKVSLYQRASSSTAFYPLGIYITAVGDNGRTFLDIYGGVNPLNTTSSNYGGFAEPNVRIGNLQGLPNVGGQSPNGWGIYTDNGYFKGIIAADRGYIGTGSKYWVIGNYEDGSNSNNDRSYIYNGTNSITSTTQGVYLGTDGIRNYKDSTHYVTIKNGVISALGVDLSGKITASSGSIGGWNIGTDTNKSLYYGNQTPGATTTNLVLSPTSTTNSNAIGGSATGLKWFLSAGKVFGVTTAGALYATSGKIGSWEIGSNYLLTGTWGTGESALISTGSSGSKKIGGSDLINNWVFTAGANFGVTKSGALYANSANISGKITATSGTIGGIDIIDGNLNVSSINIGDLSGEIGGRNLLSKDNVLSQTTPYTEEKYIYTGLYGAGAGLRFPASIFEIGTRYVLSFKFKKISGTLTAIGGHCQGFSGFSKNFIIDGEKKENRTYFQGYLMNDDSDVHSVEVHLIFNGNASDNNLYIQPNRGAYTQSNNNKFQIWDLQLEKGDKATDWTPAPEDVNADIEDARKVATNYLSMDSTGIMVADMNDGEQKPSEATGRNVFIDNDSVDIRNGTLTLASFTGDNTKFYDPVYKKELATFGTGGAIIGANNEQRFVIEKDSVSAINENGAPVFSIVSTNKTFETEAEAAPAGEVGAYISGSTITLDAGDSVSENTFYIRNISVIIAIYDSSSVLNNVKVNSVNADATRFYFYDNRSYGYPYSKHSIAIPESPAFSCNYGISKTTTYEITANFINDYNDSYNLTCNFTLTYDGSRTLDLSVMNGSCTRTSGNNKTIARFDSLASGYSYTSVISSMAYTRAPAMTFGTRTGGDGMLSSIFGQGLYAEKDGEFVIGRFNEQELQTESKYAFVVGNGETEEHRSNALTIDWSGNIYFGVNVAGLDVDAELATAIINAGWDDDVYDD